MPYLIQKNADGSMIKQWEFRGSPLTVGRGDKANAIIDDVQMSRVHFSIAPGATGYVLEDCQSSNGTFLNGKIIKGPVPLQPGDRLRAGETNFVFEAALGTVIGNLEKEGLGYSTYIRELSDKKPQRPPPRAS